MRKYLSKLLCIVLTFNLIASASILVITAPAQGESLNITYEKFKNMLNGAADIAESMTSADRVFLYNLAKGYFEENAGIDFLIDVVKEGAFDSFEILNSNEDLTEYLTTYKSELIFALSFIRSIEEDEEESVRKAAFDKITEKKAYSPLNSSQLKALNDTYKLYFDENFRTTLKEVHEIDAPVLFNLISCLKGMFVVTDKSSDRDKIALKSINSGFEDRLEENLEKHFTSINGKSSAYGKEVLAAVVDILNGATDSQIGNFKTLFKVLNMYEKYSSSPTPSPSPSPSRDVRPARPPILVPSSEPVVVPPPAVDEQARAVVQNFSDFEPSRWSTPYVSALINRNIFRGYEDNNFRPQQGITREELAVVLVRALGLESRLENLEDPAFADMDDFGDWSKKAIALLTQMQILRGYEDGTFKPKNVISRQELAVILARALSKEAGDVSVDFADKGSIASWAENEIKKVYALGIIRGYEDKTFQPGSSVTREEVAAMLYNFMFTENLL